MTSQKFHRGDLVRVTVDRKRTIGRQHFPTNFEAYVLGSYADLCHVGANAGYGKDKFALHIVNSRGNIYRGHHAWFPEHELILVAARTMRSIERVERLERGESL